MHDYTLPANVENLVLVDSTADNGVGNELDNLIVGNTRDNVLDGGAGNDVLVGGIFRELEGPPYIEGTGSDILIGGEGDDILMEDAGNLSFVGGRPFLGNGLNRRETVPRDADDLLIGGIGNDTYIVHSQEQMAWSWRMKESTRWRARFPIYWGSISKIWNLSHRRRSSTMRITSFLHHRSMEQAMNWIMS